jgi:nucleoside-diphosphate-sugar epimerase
LRILITGGNGFIGSHLAQRLLQIGHDVTLLDISFGRNTDEIECTKVKGDVCEGTPFQMISEYPDVLFHAAAVSRVEWGEIDPEKCLRTNVMGLMNTVNWVLRAERHPHFVLASSREVYGEPRWTPVTEDYPKQPISVYGTTKLTSELLLTHFGLVNALRYTVMRFSNVYGSTRDLPERVIPRFTANALAGKPLKLNGGNQILDFTFIDDVIEGLDALISRIESGSQSVLNTDFHLCSGQGTSIKKLAELVKETTMSKSDIIFSSQKSYDVARFIGDSSKARRILGFRAKVDIQSGLKKYFERVLSSKGNA